MSTYRSLRKLREHVNFDERLRALLCDEGYSRNEAAKILGVSIGTVNGRAYRLRLVPKRNRVEPLSAEQRATLRVLWASSLTLVEMAAKLNCTMSQLRADIGRLKLPKRRRSKATMSPAAKARKGGFVLGGGSKAPSMPKLAPKRGLCRLTDTPDRRHCHFPIGNPDEPDFRFCGEKAAVPGAPYCPEHMRVCYQPREMVEQGEAA